MRCWYIKRWLLTAISLYLLFAVMLLLPFHGILSSQLYADNGQGTCYTDEGKVPSEQQPARGYPSPAAIYCDMMGYQYEIRVDSERNQYGVCIFPDGSECDAWDFYYGRAGKEFSYCARYGYDIETKELDGGTYSGECAICVPRGSDSMKGVSRIPMLELMVLNGESLIEVASVEGQMNDECVDYRQSYTMSNGYTRPGIPSAFDWRDKNGHSYIGGIRDQGSCGSCYAFAACAAAEGVYNWANGLYDENCADFSESFVIWCLSSLPQYNEHFYGCRGADYSYSELEALTVEGVCNEDDFPYTTMDPGECSHWDDRGSTFNSWQRVPCGDVLSIKEAIMNFGTVDAAVWVGWDFSSYDEGIYQDSNTECWADPCYYTPTNHAISLVGWDDNGDPETSGYWILRNSWGSGWGEEGYMRIGYHSALVSCEVCRLSYAVTSVGGEAFPVGGFDVILQYIIPGIAIMAVVYLRLRDVA